MRVLDGGGSIKIAGAKVGEAINILLLNNKTETVILSDLTRYGIEGFQVNLKDQPAAFYPYASILKVSKYKEQ